MFLQNYINIKVKRKKTSICWDYFDFECKEKVKMSVILYGEEVVKNWVPQQQQLLMETSTECEGGQTSSGRASHMISLQYCTVIVCSHNTKWGHPNHCSFSHWRKLIVAINIWMEQKIQSYFVTIQWFVHVSFEIYDDCKGYTGSILTPGPGAVTSFSRKQQ